MIHKTTYDIHFKCATLKIMKYLGIDYGSKKVGLALSDEGGKLAFPKVVLKNDVYLLDSIKEIIKEENVDEVVIGESLAFGGDPNKVMKDILPLRELLQKDLNLPVHLEKEFLTSVEARRYQPPAKKKAKPVDAAAAALILQRHLDKINQ